jgi:hypothetical protein
MISSAINRAIEEQFHRGGESMLFIKTENPVSVGEMFDYELEDGTLLHNTEWNGEDYTIRNGNIPNRTETVYTPVYEISETDEESFNIIGFEKS